MDVAILLGTLKRCVHIKAASQRATFNIDRNGIHSTAATGGAWLTREMEQCMDMGEKIR